MLLPSHAIAGVSEVAEPTIADGSHCRVGHMEADKSWKILSKFMFASRNCHEGDGGGGEKSGTREGSDSDSTPAVATDRCPGE